VHSLSQVETGFYLPAGGWVAITAELNGTHMLSHHTRCSGIILVAAITLASPALADGPPAGVSATEWAGIQSQIEVERHTITESDRPGRLYRADNPAQRFAAHFGAENVLITPSGRGDPAWELGLRLTSWGAADNLQQVEFAHATAEDNRVEYRRGPLTEWYHNTTMGLEQGFTIDAPPGDDITELVLEMTLDGDLTLELSESGNAVTFRQEGSNTNLTYSGLDAWDAVGEPLEARMELAGDGTRVRLVVGVTGAVWPITVDPVFSLAARLLPEPHIDLSGAQFGASVGIDGDLMVVGRLQSDGWGPLTAHIFRRDQGAPNGWGHVTHIKPNDAPGGENVAVAISGDTVVLGAPGVDPPRAYVFRQDHGGINAWGQVAEITPGGDSGGKFGSSVAISADTVVVGAYKLTVSGFGNAGAAYVFQRDIGGPDAWGQTANLTLLDPERFGYFGHSVAIDADTVFVGAPLREASAFIYYRDQNGPGAWGLVAQISSGDSASQYFGGSVAISGNTAVVGRPYDDEFGTQSGSAYVFERDYGGPDTWGQVARVTASDASEDALFGASIDISGDTAIVGAHGDSYSGAYTGSAYIFRRDQGTTNGWGQVSKLTASDGSGTDFFAMSVAIDGDTVVSGARYLSRTFPAEGSVYLFRRDQGGPGAWQQEIKVSCPPIVSSLMDHFGQAVAISGDTVVIGAPDDPDTGLGYGQVHIFERRHGGANRWGLVATVSSDDQHIHDGYGTAVAVSGDTLAVGAYNDWDNGIHSGSVFVYERDHGGPDAWGLIAKLTPDDAQPYAYFGMSVSISGDTAAVGAPGDDWFPGTTYLFQRDDGGPTAWGQVAKLRPSDISGMYNRFSWSTSISGDTVISGAPWYGSVYVFNRNHGGPNAWGEVTKINDLIYGWKVVVSGNTAAIDGSGEVGIFDRDHGGPDYWGRVGSVTAPSGSDPLYLGSKIAINGDTLIIGASGDSVNGEHTGSAYAFRRDEGGPNAWGQIAKAVAFDGQHGDGFGHSVAISQDTIVAGAPYSHHVDIWSGSAYVFSLGDGFFSSGFETGDTSEWAATVP